MLADIETCPIWGTNIESASWRGDGFFEYLIIGSSRVGRDYRVTRDAALILNADGDHRIGDDVRAKLTTTILDAPKSPADEPSFGAYPCVDRYKIDEAESNDALTVGRRLTRLLKWLNTPPASIGETMLVSTGETMNEALAHTESSDPSEVMELARGLARKGWIELPHGGVGTAFSCSITVEGMQTLEDH